MNLRRPGFTLVELLIVVVIIGILASIAIPKFGTTKGKAYMAAMRSDLHNLTVAEEAYLYDNRIYTNDAAQLRFSTSPGVQLLELHEYGAAGWSAKVTHPQAFPKTCAVFVGPVAPLAPATMDGVIACNE